MGSYLSFYAERLATEGWQSVTGLNDLRTPEDLYYAKNFWLLFDLFMGRVPVFPIRRGFPEATSPLLAAYSSQGQSNDCYWVPVEELQFDEWNQERLLLKGAVPARFCSLFGNGRDPFPGDQLVAAGASNIWSCRRLSICQDNKPIDYAGELAHIPHNTPPDHAVEVTWTQTLAEIVGEESMTKVVDRLRSMGSPEKLRLIAAYD